MVRKHFQTHAQKKINTGQLIKLGMHYYVRYMNDTDIPLSLALQKHVTDILKQDNKSHYIIPKDDQKLRHLLAQGNALIGTFVRDPDPAKPDRLGAHMIVIYPQNAAETGLADPSVLPDKDLGKISVVSNILVHQDFRGNRLMQQMLDEWLKLAAADGKSHAVAEICVDNEFSWGVFLDCGFVIYGHDHDYRDGSDIVYVHKPLDKEFVYSSDPKDVTLVKLFDDQGGLDVQAHNTFKTLLDQGYHALDFDRHTKFMLMAKCMGTVPLIQPGQAPPPAANNNQPPGP